MDGTKKTWIWLIESTRSCNHPTDITTKPYRQTRPRHFANQLSSQPIRTTPITQMSILLGAERRSRPYYTLSTSWPKKESTQTNRSSQKVLSYLYTDPILQTILLAGLHAWQRKQVLIPSHYPVQYRKLIAQQNRIGWRQLFNGRVSRQWSTLQQAHLRKNSLLTSRQSGPLWTVSVITSLWTSWHTIWEDRNQKVHGHDTLTRNRIQREHAIAELQLFLIVKTSCYQLIKKISWIQQNNINKNLPIPL